MDNFFSQKLVIHLKGTSHPINKNTIKNSVDTILEYLELAMESKKKLIIVWEGNDVKQNYFTEILIQVDEELTKILGDYNSYCQFLYMMSNTSPDKVKIPTGLQFSKKHIYNITAGRGVCEFDNILLKYIHEYNDKFIMMIDEWDFLYSDEIAEEEDLYKKLASLNLKDLEIKYRENNQEYFSNDYGYLLLGLASVKLTQSKNILYIGSDKILRAQYAALKLWEKQINQIIIK